MGKTDLLTRSKHLFSMIREYENDTDIFHAIWDTLYQMKFDSRAEMLDEILNDYDIKISIKNDNR